MNCIQITSVIAVMIAQPIIAQQAQTPPPNQPASKADTPNPCNPTPSQPHKVGWLEKKARDLACKKNANACNLPSSIDDAMGTQPQKPCTAAPAVKTATAPTTPVQQAPPQSAKPVYVCPPKTALIANTPYCLAADHTTVDAIPLPANQQLPTTSPR